MSHSDKIHLEKGSEFIPLTESLLANFDFEEKFSGCVSQVKFICTLRIK